MIHHVFEGCQCVVDTMVDENQNPIARRLRIEDPGTGHDYLYTIPVDLATKLGQQLMGISRDLHVVSGNADQAIRGDGKVNGS